MKILIALTVLIAVAYATSVEEQWQQFKETHGKTYKSVLEEKKRFAIFKDTLREIEEHNVRYANGEFSYTMGVNQFSDMTQAEFEATLTPFPSLPRDVSYHSFNESGIVGDENINWVTKGYVTPVRNQGACGSCWAFSAAGAIEALFKKNGDDLVVLSPQNLLDCTEPKGNRGCRGGLMTSAFKFVKQNGIVEESEYKYKAKKNPTCQQKAGKKISDYVVLDNKSEDVLLKALTDMGPISVCLDSKRMKNYASGVIDTTIGCSSRIDHAVLLVGAGTENGKKYWLLKNSWGTKYGENGYMKLVRGKKACGITRLNSVPK